jgi:7-carboxy-7-deazaguanine synthase
VAYRLKSIFRTIQGEGLNAGRPAVFVRFTGCNLWSGLEEDRGKGGSCSKWCDTDFARGKLSFAGAGVLCDAVERCWGGVPPLVVLTGGEPMLQMTDDLHSEIMRRGWNVWMETNGTVPASFYYGFKRTVSPKAGSNFRLAGATEVKLIYPQQGLMPNDLEAAALAEMGNLPRNLFLQPMDVGNHFENQRLAGDAAQVCLTRPHWRLSLQTHKFIPGIE